MLMTLSFQVPVKCPQNSMPRVREIIKNHGWKIAENKQRLARIPNRLRVHGLLVHGDKPRLTKGYRNRIRAFKYLLAAGRVSNEDMRKIQGHLAYAKSVEIIERG